MQILLFVPLAPEAARRHRVVPRYPALGVLLGAMGAALLLHAIWAAQDAQALRAGLSSVLAVLSLLSGARYRRQRLWEGWFEVRGDALHVNTPSERCQVPLSRAQVFRRSSDGSVLVTTADRGRDTLILPRGARGRYWVDGAEELVGDLAERVTVRPVESLRVLPREER